MDFCHLVKALTAVAIENYLQLVDWLRPIGWQKQAIGVADQRADWQDFGRQQAFHRCGNVLLNKVSVRCICVDQFTLIHRAYADR